MSRHFCALFSNCWTCRAHWDQSRDIEVAEGVLDEVEQQFINFMHINDEKMKWADAPWCHQKTPHKKGKKYLFWDAVLNDWVQGAGAHMGGRRKRHKGRWSAKPVEKRTDFELWLMLWSYRFVAFFVFLEHVNHLFSPWITLFMKVCMRNTICRQYWNNWSGDHKAQILYCFMFFDLAIPLCGAWKIIKVVFIVIVTIGGTTCKFHFPSSNVSYFVQSFRDHNINMEQYLGIICWVSFNRTLNLHCQ